MSQHDALPTRPEALAEFLSPQGDAEGLCVRRSDQACRFTQDCRQTQDSLRQEAADLLRKAEVLRKVRVLLDPVWSLHPDWTFAEVCAHALAEHPELFQEVSP